MRPRKVLLENTGAGFIYWVQWALAQIFMGASLWVVLWLGDEPFSSQYRGLLVFSCVLSIPVVAALGSYRRNLSSLQGCIRIFISWLLTLYLCWLSAGVVDSRGMFDVSVLKQWAIFSLLVQFLIYVPVHHLARYYRQKLMYGAGVLVYGTGNLSSVVAGRLRHIDKEKFLGVVLCGPREHGDFDYPVLGYSDDLQEVISRYDIGRLYITLSLSEAQKIEKLYVELIESNVDVVWVPDIESLNLINHSVTELEGLPVISLNQSPLTRYPLAALIKDILDRSISFLCLIAFSPLLLLVATVIKVTSRGPVIFKQKRHGWNGQVIEVWKFRSMRVHEDTSVSQATRNDPRITPIGRFIRRTSVDELPQLFNVLQGNMSLVGPRPHAVAHNYYYSGKIQAYMARHRIKPGITGLAQISGCRGETETLDKMERRVELDLDYINGWSLWLDFKILFKTPVSLFREDAY